MSHPSNTLPSYDAWGKHAVQYVQSRYGTHIVAIYGIGSAFLSQFPILKTPIDICVLLDDLQCIPRQDGRLKIFEDETYNDLQYRYSYATLADYQNKDRFEAVSLGNHTWSIRALRASGVLLYGTDIRHQLPEAAYTPSDYEDIFRRAAYHLEGSMRYNRPDPVRLSKGIFKLGFLLITMQDPDDDIHRIEEIYKRLLEYASHGVIRQDTAEAFKLALRIRMTPTITIPNYIEERKRIIKNFIAEMLMHVDGISWTELRAILMQGFGNRPFMSVILTYEEDIDSDILTKFDKI